MNVLKKIRYKSKYWGIIKLIQLICIRFLQKIIYWEWLLFYTKNLTEPDEMQPSGISIKFRKAEYMEIQAMDQTQFPLNEKVIKDLEADCECIIGIFQTQIVYFAWINYLQIYEQKVMNYALLQNQAYVYRVYTLPAFRGYGIATAGYQFLFDYLRKKNKTECIVAVNLENRPSIHSIVKSGFRKFGQLIYYKSGKKTRIIYTNLSKNSDELEKMA